MHASRRSLPVLVVRQPRARRTAVARFAPVAARPQPRAAPYASTRLFQESQQMVFPTTVRVRVQHPPASALPVIVRSQPSSSSPFSAPGSCAAHEMLLFRTPHDDVLIRVNVLRMPRKHSVTIECSYCLNVT